MSCRYVNAADLNAEHKTQMLFDSNESIVSASLLTVSSGLKERERARGTDREQSLFDLYSKISSPFGQINRLYVR